MWSHSVSFAFFSLALPLAHFSPLSSTPSSFTGRVVKHCLQHRNEGHKTQWNRWLSRETQGEEGGLSELNLL